METYLNSRGTTVQPGDRERPPAPYRLFPAAIGLWLARGERLGQALRWTVMAIAALLARRSIMRRKVARQTPIVPPPGAAAR